MEATTTPGYEIELFGIKEAMFIVTTNKDLYDWITEDGVMPDYVKEVEDYDYIEDWNDRALFAGMISDAFPDKVQYFYDRKEYQKHLTVNNISIEDSTEGSIY